MQHYKEIKWVGLSVSMSLYLAQPRWAAALAKTHASSLKLTVLAESQKLESICIVDWGEENHQLFWFLGSMQLLEVSKNGTWYSG